MFSLRFWTAIGRLFRLYAVFYAVVLAVIVADVAIELIFSGSHRHAYLPQEGVAGVFVIVVLWLMWQMEPRLVANKPTWLRWFAFAVVVIWVITSLGIALAFVKVAYWLTRAPAPPVRAAPADFNPTAMIGPSGAMAWASPERSNSVGMLESGTAVQVGERRGVLAHVMDATGLAGWVDQRTIAELV